MKFTLQRVKVMLFQDYIILLNYWFPCFFSPYGCIIYEAVNFFTLIPFEFLPQPVNLSENLENVLLSMCEESSQLRISLTKVLEVSYLYYYTMFICKLF